MKDRITATFDEIGIGDRYESPGRTITEADVVNFSMFTGNWLEIHTNRQFAAGTKIGKRLVQGSLVFSLIPGLIRFGPSVMANYGLDKLRFVHPVFIDDTIYVVAEAAAKKEKNDRSGVVTFLMRVFNQDGVLVQRSDFSLLFARRHEDIEALAAQTRPRFDFGET